MEQRQNRVKVVAESVAEPIMNAPQKTSEPRRPKVELREVHSAIPAGNPTMPRITGMKRQMKIANVP